MFKNSKRNTRRHKNWQFLAVSPKNTEVTVKNVSFKRNRTKLTVSRKGCDPIETLLSDVLQLNTLAVPSLYSSFSKRTLQLFSDNWYYELKMNWNLKPATKQAAIITLYWSVLTISFSTFVTQFSFLFLTLAKFESIIGDEKIKTRDFIIVKF